MRIPRKLKKEKKKDGVYLLIRVSIPVVSKLIKYDNKTRLMDLLAPGAFNPSNFKDVCK